MINEKSIKIAKNTTTIECNKNEMKKCGFRIKFIKEQQQIEKHHSNVEELKFKKSSNLLRNR